MATGKTASTLNTRGENSMIVFQPCQRVKQQPPTFLNWQNDWWATANIKTPKDQNYDLRSKPMTNTYIYVHVRPKPSLRQLTPLPLPAPNSINIVLCFKRCSLSIWPIREAWRENKMLYPHNIVLHVFPITKVNNKIQIACAISDFLHSVFWDGRSHKTKPSNIIMCNI